MNPRLSANTGFLYPDLPFLERIVAAARDGFDAVEFHDEWREAPRDDLRAALREAGLPVVGINARMGETAGRSACPGMAAEARADADEAVDAALDVGAGAVHLLSGRTEATAEALATLRATLRHAVARADGRVALLIEPLCPAAQDPYPLRRVDEAAALVASLGRGGAAVLLDLFHAHAAGDDPVALVARHGPAIGHVQLAHPVTRAEPATDGPHAVGPMIAAIRAAGYGGPFGCEYRPAGRTEDGLAWRDHVRTRA